MPLEFRPLVSIGGSSNTLIYLINTTTLDNPMEFFVKTVQPLAHREFGVGFGRALSRYEEDVADIISFAFLYFSCIFKL